MKTVRSLTSFRTTSSTQKQMGKQKSASAAITTTATTDPLDPTTTKNDQSPIYKPRRCERKLTKVKQRHQKIQNQILVLTSVRHDLLKKSQRLEEKRDRLQSKVDGRIIDSDWDQPTSSATCSATCSPTTRARTPPLILYGCGTERSNLWSPWPYSPYSTAGSPYSTDTDELMQNFKLFSSSEASSEEQIHIE